MKLFSQSSPLRPYVRGAFCFLLGILSALCFVIGQAGYAGMSELPASATSYLWSALAVCFGLLNHHVFVKKAVRLHWLTALFALVFGVVNTLGGMLFAHDQWDMLASPMQLAMALLKSVGQAAPMAAAMSWVDHTLRCGVLKKRTWADDVRECRHDVLCVMLVLIVCWSPYLLAFYPGTVCWDLGEMVAQFFGQTEMDTWHPVFTTWVMGSCVWIGRLFGSDNLGAALFTALQTLALSYALSRAVHALKEMGVNRLVRWIAVAFFAVTPIWAGYAQFISKDTLYTACMLLFVLNVLRVAFTPHPTACGGHLPLKGKAKKEAGGHLPNERKAEEADRQRLPLEGKLSPKVTDEVKTSVELFIWGLLACLLRSNGLYVVLPTAIVLCIIARPKKFLIPALAGAVACALLFSNVLLPALGIRDETASGIYSVCFQQSARVLRDHAESVTPEEYAEIDAVLDAANLPELYEPWISDPVKYTFRQYGQGAEAEKAALARYRGTWLAMFSKYPLDYLESFFAGNIGYYTFTPKIEGETYNNQAGNRLVFETYELGDSRGPDPRFLDTTQIAALEPMRQLLALFARGWRHIPLLSLLYACASYTWLLVAAAVSVCRQKRWGILVAFLPALLSLGVCMLSPVNDYFRYFLPIVAMTLPLIGAASAKEENQ